MIGTQDIQRLRDLAERTNGPDRRNRVLDMAADLEQFVRDVSQLQYGPGSQLWDYWTKGKGAAKWVGSVHKWTTLHRLLVAAGVPVSMADGLTTNIIMAVMPTYMKTHGKA